MSASTATRSPNTDATVFVRPDRSTMGFFGRLSLAWRSSLQIKVVFSVLTMTIVSLAVLSALMSTTIRDGIFNQRVDAVMSESARAFSGTQSLLNSSTAANSTQVQQLLKDTIAALQAGASGQRDVFLWRMRTAAPVQVTVNDVSSNPELGGLVSAQLREAVAAAPQQAHWQSVGIPTEGGVHPGVVVGSSVEVPVAGTFELYLMYSMETEQYTLTFLQRVLAVSLGSLTIVLALITWLVTRQVVHPIITVSAAAGRIADGHLDERLPVRGYDEVAALESSFNAMAASLQDQIERLGHLSALQRRFVSDVSHELRTPLTTIRMAADVLYDARNDLVEPGQRSVELLKDQIDRFELLLTDLLEISRFDAGAARLDIDSRDLTAMTAGIIEGMVPLAEAKGVDITYRSPIDRVVADVDAIRFERIVRNLLANAIEHAEGKPVHVDLAATVDAVAVRVRDHGIGLNSSELAHVFDRFWRADPARARTTGGTGLGLSISMEDALLHGGRLEADGSPGHGAIFILTLPRHAGAGAIDHGPLSTDEDRDPLLQVMFRHVSTYPKAAEGKGPRP